MCYCVAGKVRGACVPWCVCVILYVSVFNVFNLTTSFYVAELVCVKKHFRLIVMIATDNKVF